VSPLLAPWHHASRAALLFLFAAAALLAAGCRTSIAGYCNEVCGCSTCSEDARYECVDIAEDAQKRAHDADCAASFDAYTACAANAVTCNDSVARVDGCDTEARALYDCAGDIGFGLTACEVAVFTFAEKYAECGIELPPGTGAVPCNSEAASRRADCRAECIDKASCEAITGEDGAASVEMNNCLTACEVA
jgi:hypothetical protein